MNDLDFDAAMDNLDGLFDNFDGVTVEGGTDAESGDDGCEGGACKI